MSLEEYLRRLHKASHEGQIVVEVKGVAKLTARKFPDDCTVILANIPVSGVTSSMLSNKCGNYFAIGTEAATFMFADAVGLNSWTMYVKPLNGRFIVLLVCCMY